MTDLSLAPARKAGHNFFSPEAQALVKKRYGAERRFQAYGIAAIAFAAIFILLLVGDIVRKGYTAFVEHYATVEMTVTHDQIGAGGKTDADSLRQADWSAVVREGLRPIYPEVTNRTQRSKLYNELVSSGAGIDIRNKLMADPSLIGKPVKTQVLLSDDADLYFKGFMTNRAERVGRGSGGVSGTTGDVEFATSSNDFANELIALRQLIGAQARRSQLEVVRLRYALDNAPPDRRAGAEQALNVAVARTTDLERRSQSAGGSEKLDENVPSLLVALNGGVIKVGEIGSTKVSGTVVSPLANQNDVKAGDWRIITLETPETSRKLSDQQITWLERLRERGLVSSSFATRFLVSGDSREAEMAGILGGLTGSLLTMLVTLLLCLPIGVAAAIYLEEFAPKNRLTDIIEVNINNLAAVPSIVFGLLGLALFLNTFGMPRSSPLVGGLVLALLVLPTIIIASRAALKAVPPSIREAALGVGASHQQAVFHHVLPLAMPGILTGTIIGMAHALGETAPLLMIGMVAFIVEIPKSLTESATVLPVQIFLWSDLPEAAFQAKTAGAIIVLLLFLFLMNGAAIWLRKKFERRW
ncbi:MAG: phosphate ABC transporter permease PstA [Beijerinckiaceae bacterium]